MTKLAVPKDSKIILLKGSSHFTFLWHWCVDSGDTDLGCERWGRSVILVWYFAQTCVWSGARVWTLGDIGCHCSSWKVEKVPINATEIVSFHRFQGKSVGRVEPWWETAPMIGPPVPFIYWFRDLCYEMVWILCYCLVTEQLCQSFCVILVVVQLYMATGDQY